MEDFNTIMAKNGCAMDRFLKSVDDFYRDFLKWYQIELDRIEVYAACVIALKQKIEGRADTSKKLRKK